MAIPKRRLSDKAFSGSLPVRIRHSRRLGKLTQAALAKAIGVQPSAVAQWELPNGTSPTVSHLLSVADACCVAFEWLATGRGVAGAQPSEIAAVDSSSFAADHLEERLLLAFRRVPSRKRETFVAWMESFF
ncbi:helix-turn-helix domain-containing protein [Dokdonella sp.]|uniref:helix-turn-helix domain-containing protein n=1 Tax=Dokdonella sp. TaxID=2291710 RepID=UPI00352993EB